MRYGITRKWIKTNLLLLLLLLIGAEAIFISSMYTSYYDGVRRAMDNRFYSISGSLKVTGTQQTDAAAAARDRALLLRQMVEQFDAKDRFELMLLRNSGQILSTSSGRVPGAAVPQDYMLALENSSGRGETIYRTSTGEKVMAVTYLVPYPSDEIAAIRLVTSLTLVDQQLAELVIFSVLVCGVILLFSVSSGLFFVKGIVRPLNAVEATARRIARGELDIQIEQEYEGEVGRLCESINHMAQELQRTEKMKNEFISSVSHELRTPLTSIKGWLETLPNLPPQNENYKKGMEIISKETDRLYAMVEELLDFSRLQSGVKMEFQRVDLVAEVSDAVLMMQARMYQQGLRLRYEEPQLPLPVLADPNRLRQVFINILDNAVKYSNEGGCITIDFLQDGESAFVQIQDEGRGIAPDDLENVKLKFFKAKNSVRGSGIGLAVVDEIVKALDGDVDIASTLGKGTTVTVRLPLLGAKGPVPQTFA